MEKAKVSEGDIGESVLLETDDVPSLEEKKLGYDRITVRCKDGVIHLCMIRDMNKRIVYIQSNDMIPASSWTFKQIHVETGCSYTEGQAEYLRSKAT